MKTYKLKVSPITFKNSQDLMEVVYDLDNVRLYQSNKRYEDPAHIDVLDGNNMGSGTPVGYSYDTADCTLEIDTDGGICAITIKEAGFNAVDQVLDMTAQYDFLLTMKSFTRICPDLTATVQVFENGIQIDERSILLAQYESKF